MSGDRDEWVNPRWSRSPRWAGSAFWLFHAALVLVLAVGLLVRPAYVIMGPGPVFNTLGELDGKPVIEVPKDRAQAAGGVLDFTTVNVEGGPERRPALLSLFWAWLAPDRDIVPESLVFPPGQTQQQATEENAAMMADSQEVAAAVALRALGQRVPAVVRVAGVADDSPAKGRLAAGDILVSLDGTEVTGADSVRAAVQKHKAGEEVAIVVRRGGTERTVTTATVERQGRIVLGITLAHGFDLPFPVTVNAGHVGGPSAGLMFSLGIYDKLTPGDLTGGQTIAGTGTLDDQGRVGPIGGIPQKLAAAADAGAKVFLVPADNCAEAKSRPQDGQRQVRVENFEGALTAVKAIADGHLDGLPTC